MLLLNTFCLDGDYKGESCFVLRRNFHGGYQTVSRIIRQTFQWVQRHQRTEKESMGKSSCRMWLGRCCHGPTVIRKDKKKFNVRRKNSKGPSGSGAADMSAQQEDFKDMAYLSWLAPFVKLRQTKSNMNFKAMTSAARADKLMSVSENEGGESEEEESTVSVVDVEPLEPLDDNETLENEDETTTNRDRLLKSVEQLQVES